MPTVRGSRKAWQLTMCSGHGRWSGGTTMTDGYTLGSKRELLPFWLRAILRKQSDPPRYRRQAFVRDAGSDDIKDAWTYGVASVVTPVDQHRKLDRSDAACIHARCRTQTPIQYRLKLRPWLCHTHAQIASLLHRRHDPPPTFSSRMGYRTKPDNRGAGNRSYGHRVCPVLRRRIHVL
jgi:hypothetical protein